MNGFNTILMQDHFCLMVVKSKIVLYLICRFNYFGCYGAAVPNTFILKG